MQESLISVLLPVFNAEKFIKDCIDSILAQTYSNFELIIIDDCSNDSSVDIIRSYTDKRIKLILKPINTGYTESLNQGLAIAHGLFIARMDADDISMPNRFELQVNFLRKNSSVAICGTDANILGANFKFNFPESYEAIKINLLFGSSLIHPTIMGRGDILKKYGYDSSLEPAEDYDLFTRVALDHPLINLSERLLNYRVHNNQTSNMRSAIQKDRMRLSMCRMFQVFKYDTEVYKREIIMNAIMPYRSIDTKELHLVLNWYQLLLKVGCNNFYELHSLGKALNRKKYNFLKFYVENPKLRIDFGTIILWKKIFIISPRWFFSYLKVRFKNRVI
ncbi:glycosyltransferase family 2 protein [Leeuwenhoekiella sp. LLG6367-2.1]|uniref:glycosyltransferase family 2 protein n=1 Tax=Leeuwenhoekiella sp. LLG6367-2.1 TaxID=3160833 RepID=UPI00386D366F